MAENKLIMIDSVDVSECEHVFARTSLFKEKNFVECTAFFLENEDSRCNCSDNPNCYYKQLKAKEQECEELKSRLNCRCFDPSINNNRCISYNRIAEDYERDLKQLDQLKAENKRYKEEITLLRKGYDEEDCTKTCPNMQIYERELKQAEQKLEKIREIANGMHDMWINKTQHTGVYNLAEHLLKCELKRIINELNEIDEVEWKNY